MLKSLLAILILVFSIETYAQLSDGQHIWIVPRGSKNIQDNYQVLASVKQFDLISINKADRKRMFITRSQVYSDNKVIDVTNAWQNAYGNNLVSRQQATEFLANYIAPAKKSSVKNYIYKIQYQKEVNQLLNKMNPQSIQNFLLTLSSFVDRSYDTEYGVDAANWIKSQVDKLVKESGRKDITTFTIETQGTDDDGNPVKQPSVVVKIGNSNEPGIVIGAHFDTYRKYDLKTSEDMCKEIPDPKFKQLCIDCLSGDKPGADDDGSGSSIVFEVARTIISNVIQFKNPIYLVWYSAEEIGMVGSQSVVEDFHEKNISVKAVLQLDQVGYSFQNDTTIWLVNNYVDINLTTYIANLIDEYVKQPVKYTACGGPCSDHVSWNAKNIPVAFPFESEMKIGQGYPFAHTPWDSFDKLSLSHMTDFAKLSIAFAVELAEPIAS